MATAKTKKTAGKQEFFTPRPTKRREDADPQDGGGSTPHSPVKTITYSEVDLAAFTFRMETLFKDFSETLTTRLDTVAADIRKDIQDIGERTSHLEGKMSEMATAHNDMAGVVETLEAKLQQCLNKVADLEDRSRRNNLKIRGVPESIHPRDLGTYVADFFSFLLPGVTPETILMDRIHRLPKPPSAPQKAPRDVILKLHYYKPREDILRALRKPDVLGSQYGHLAVYPDFSKATLQQRRLFRPITTTLRSAGILYRWGFPTKLVVLRDGTTTVFNSTEEGRTTLESWGLQIEPDVQERLSQVPKLLPEWRVR
uniref:Transposase element L1Md-A101/L1Md-A102/L1Md-A2 n=1 Tax=Leptobrachium leishanense TaxID=445787 RepID=A0A8C5QIC2_9ANUR